MFVLEQGYQETPATDIVSHPLAGKTMSVLLCISTMKGFEKPCSCEQTIEAFPSGQAILLLETEQPLLQSLIFGSAFIALTAFSGLVPPAAFKQ